MEVSTYLADRTLPKKTSSTSSGLMPALSTAPLYTGQSVCRYIRMIRTRRTLDGGRAQLSRAQAGEGAALQPSAFLLFC